jgi:hypothetical protein
MDVVREDALPVDLDHRDQLAVARLEVRIAVDRDFLEFEAQLLAPRAHLRQRALAEVAPGRVVDRDDRFRDRDPA